MPALNTILIATDFSERATRAEKRAAMLAAEHGAQTVELLHVEEARQAKLLSGLLERPLEAAQSIIAQETLKSLQQHAQQLQNDYGINCSCEVRFGHPAAEVAARAKELNADLVVVGAHGTHFFSDLFLGGTTDKLVRLCQHPLLIVKKAPRKPYGTILVPIDFSVPASAAAQWALQIAPRAALTFLHAFEVWFEGPMQYANVSRQVIHDYRAQARFEAQEEMNRFIAGLDLDDRFVTKVISFGLPGPVLRRQAQDTRPGLIVMGKQGRTRLAEMILGSVTRHAIDQTASDVLVVPCLE